jgi:hypothetical protein
VFRPLSYHQQSIPIVLCRLLLIGVALMAGSLEGCEVAAIPVWGTLKVADEGRRLLDWGRRRRRLRCNWSILP